MNKVLIKNEKEYREFVFNLLESANDRLQNSLEESFGIIKIGDCYDYDKDGNEIDEKGNIIPDDYSAPEKLVLTEQTKNQQYPMVIVYWVESSFDRLSDIDFCVVEFVTLEDFKDNIGSR